MIIHEAQITARSQMYMNSSREAFERGQMRAQGILDLPAYPGDGSTVCLTNCRCEWIYEPTEVGINCYWKVNPAAESCPDCLDRGGRWNPWTVEVPLSGSVNFYDPGAKLIEHYGLTEPTAQDLASFKKRIDQLPSPVRGLYREHENRLYFAMGPDEYIAYYKNDWLILPKGHPGGAAAEHEFIHHIVNQRYIKGPLGNYGAYKPSSPFRHALNRANVASLKNEDITMVLSVFDENAGTWATNLVQTGEFTASGLPITEAEAAQKVTEVTRYLKETGGW